MFLIFKACTFPFKGVPSLFFSSIGAIRQRTGSLLTSLPYAFDLNATAWNFPDWNACASIWFSFLLASPSFRLSYPKACLYWLTLNQSSLRVWPKRDCFETFHSETRVLLYLTFLPFLRQPSLNSIQASYTGSLLTSIYRPSNLSSLRSRSKRDCLVHKFQLWNACASISLSFLLPFLPSGLHTQSLRQANYSLPLRETLHFLL